MIDKTVCVRLLMLTIIILDGIADCAVVTPREMDLRRVYKIDYKKRPFCNAFTGCGKKRSEMQVSASQPEKYGNNQASNKEESEEFDDSLGDLIDLNAEPAVEDLMRQIMSQAKLYEAIKEASKEISLRDNNNNKQQIHFPITFNSQ